MEPSPGQYKEKLKNNVEAAEMWFVWRMINISWTEKKTNTSRKLIKTIKERQLNFLGI